MRAKVIRDGLEYLLARVFICLVQAMRIETCAVIARLLAFVASDVVALRRDVIEENLIGAFPSLSPDERRRVSRRMWEHLILMVCEIAHAPRRIHRHNWRKFITIHHQRELLGYLLDQRPTVMVSGHFGNFEMGSFVTGLLGFPAYAVARPLDNTYLDRYINRFRAANGQFVLPKQGSSARIQELLSGGGALSLLGDQNAGPKGCWVDFLGRPASCHKAIALFTLTSGAPLMVTYAKRADKPLRFEADLLGVVDPAREPDSEVLGVAPLTRWYNDKIEQAIRTAPEQYWWVHRRWKGAPRMRRSRRLAA